MRAGCRLQPHPGTLLLDTLYRNRPEQTTTSPTVPRVQSQTHPARPKGIKATQLELREDSDMLNTPPQGGVPLPEPTTKSDDQAGHREHRSTKAHTNDQLGYHPEPATGAAIVTRATTPIMPLHPLPPNPATNSSLADLSTAQNKPRETTIDEHRFDISYRLSVLARPSKNTHHPTLLCNSTAKRFP